MLKKILCKILTLGRHWWVYAPCGKYETCCVWCRICKAHPKSEWKIYHKKFLGKPKGKYNPMTKAEKKYYKELATFVRETLIPKAEKRHAFTNKIFGRKT